MKLIHLSHHEGCKRDVDYVCAKLGIECEFLQYRGGYNISMARANAAWDEWGDKLASADIVLTSDTAPLSRIVLQHLGEMRGRLVIWVCNRFDYHDARTNDCGFPDHAYYTLFKSVANDRRVSIVSYTEFEHIYARKHRGVELGRTVIKPIGWSLVGWNGVSEIPASVARGETFLLPPYHNDTHWTDMKARCDALGIPAYRGRYNGVGDMAGFRGVIHIPYAWSNFAWFEAAQASVVYLIPTKRFLLEESKTGSFFWSPPFDRDEIDSSEWYCPEHEHLMVRFDSWGELASLSRSDLTPWRTSLREWSTVHEAAMLEKWKGVFCGKP